MKESILIDEPVETDAEALVGYLKTIMGQTMYLRSYPDEINITVDEEIKFIRRMRTEANCLSLIAKDGDRIVACGGLSGDPLRKFRHSAEFGISVLQDYRGMGIGTEITRRSIEYARASEVLTKVNLCVNAENDRAAQLYERFGFVHEGRITKDWFYDGAYRDTILMGLDVEDKP